MVAGDTLVSTPPAPASHDSVVVALGDTGVRVGVDGRLVLPIVVEASCEGEDCPTSFTAIACAAVELRARPDTAAPLGARVARGDSVHVQRTDLHILEPGIVVVKQPIVRESEPSMDDDRPMPRSDTLRFTPGDTVYLLQYEQLGWWRYWWKGKTLDGAGFWGVPRGRAALGAAGADTSHAVARSQPVMERWWLLDNGTRPTGWWRVDSARTLRLIDTRGHGVAPCTERS